MVPYKVATNLDMVCPRMLHRILGQVNCTSIITFKRNFGKT